MYCRGRICSSCKVNFVASCYSGSIAQNNLLATPVAQNRDLYNGNITTMATHTPAFTESAYQTQQFGYDQLNRIKESKVLGGNTNSYHTRYSYDANGNIDSLFRYNAGGDTLFDALVYNYESKAKGYLNNTNKLRWVDDNGQEGKFGDIKDQGVDNYAYDDIGNLIKDKQEEIEKIEWTVYGKIRKVIRTEESTKPSLEFGYDASGNRISKKVIWPEGLIKITYYIRDASGNVMAVYQKQEESSLIALSEHHIYGSSRLGIARTIAGGQVGITGSRIYGLKDYEISDHLGNVRVVLSDARNSVGLTSVTAAYDYFPFGMIMPGRKVDNGYRYGYNGKEKESELEGDFDFGSRIYDSRIARWLSLDKKHKDYPDQSPYHFTGNNPIMLIEYMGDDYGIAIDHASQTITIQANIYVADYYRTGPSYDPQYSLNNAQAAANYLNSQTAVFQVVDANGVTFNYTVQMQINVIPESQTPKVARGIDPVRAAANNDPIGNSYYRQLKEVPSDQLGDRKVDGVTTRNKNISVYDYFPTDTKKGLYWYPDHVENQNTRAGIANTADVTDSHEIGHLFLGNNTSLYFHNQNNTFMTSQENNPSLTPALIFPQNFFGTILGQAGLGTTPAATGTTPAANAKNPNTVLNVNGTSPTNFESGQVLNNQ
jgi:RHS repeat-associated protein